MFATRLVDFEGVILFMAKEGFGDVDSFRYEK